MVKHAVVSSEVFNGQEQSQLSVSCRCHLGGAINRRQDMQFGGDMSFVILQDGIGRIERGMVSSQEKVV